MSLETSPPVLPPPAASSTIEAQPQESLFSSPPPPVEKLDSTTLPPQSLSSPPPPVEAPLSDVRSHTEPVSAQEAADIRHDRLQNDIEADGELAKGVLNETSLAQENHLSPPLNAQPKPESEVPDVNTIQTQTETESAIVPDVSLPHHPATSTGVIEPTPTPVPTIESAIPPPAATLKDESKMDLDSPVSSTASKTVRPREEDHEMDEPASKRIKADDEAPSTLPSTHVEPTTNGTAESQVNGMHLDGVAPSSEAVSPGTIEPKPTIDTEMKDTKPTVDAAELLPENIAPATPAVATKEEDFSLPMTEPQSKHLSKTLGNLRRAKDGQPFVNPVDPVALNIPTYPNIVKNPMDLTTMDTKLKEKAYNSVEAFVTDFRLIVSNCEAFNGPLHAITQMAYNLRASFDRQIANTPPHDYVELSAAEKKAQKLSMSRPPAIPKREPRAATVPKTPSTPSATQTFALGPQGLPTIRRDSTLGDGRPKREIHPPAPRDLPYSQKPKRKKYALELRFCSEVLDELKKGKYQPYSYPFLNPVDPVALNIPTYHKIVKEPMDISTVEAKLKNGQYEKASEFDDDIRLMFANCYRFNPPDHPVHKLGKSFEEVYDLKWATKKSWLRDHAPKEAPKEVEESEESEEEEESSEEESSEDEVGDVVSTLEKQIAEMSSKLQSLKRKGDGSEKKKKAKKEKRESISKPSKKKDTPKKSKKKDSDKFKALTQGEKLWVASAVGELEGAAQTQAITIMTSDNPVIQRQIQNEEEIEIELLSENALFLLAKLIGRPKYGVDESGVPRKAPPPSAKKRKAEREKKEEGKKKKNRPMGKSEQEKKISELRRKLAKRSESGSEEDDVKPAVARDESSDDSESESSEED